MQWLFRIKKEESSLLIPSLKSSSQGSNPEKPYKFLSIFPLFLSFNGQKMLEASRQGMEILTPQDIEVVFDCLE